MLKFVFLLQLASVCWSDFLSDDYAVNDYKSYDNNDYETEESMYDNDGKYNEIAEYNQGYEYETSMTYNDDRSPPRKQRKKRPKVWIPFYRYWKTQGSDHF